MLLYLAVEDTPVEESGPHPVIPNGGELIIGLLMGLAVRVVFYALEMAGQIISGEMGLSTSASLDPMNRNQSMTTSVMLFYLGALLFVASGSHHAVLFAYLRSYALAPPGAYALNAPTADVLVFQTGRIFALAVQMAAPMLAVNFLVTFTFAILGRAAPSINAFAESFSFRLLAGFLVLGLTIALTARYVLDFLQHAPEGMLRLVPR